MATILLSAAGAALGGSIGGSVLGLSTAVIGRFVGASIGRAIDQRIMGQGSQAIETGRVERFRLTNAGEGAAVPRVFGRMRIAGQVIWASGFNERVNTSGGGKGAPSQPKVSEYSYSVSLAIALCEGRISGIGRIWADGAEISPDDLNMRIYDGSDEQLPDPKMEAVEGAGQVPAYRGVAYVVFEDLGLSRFGSRIPQFTFEVIRPVPESLPGAEKEPARAVRGVAMMPGSGEYALATTRVHFDHGTGKTALANVNSPSGKSDLVTSLDQLETALPNCEAVSLIVSWFGNDLRCGSCEIRPKVEQSEFDGTEMPWSVAGLDRSTAQVVARDQDDRPVYGGTPADASVIEAIQAMTARGQAVMFYPFMLMDQISGNGLPDPYSDAPTQAVLPWRGRITTSEAPGRPGSPDGTVTAAEEVAAFFGTAAASDFAVSGGTVTYTGPQEWRYRRFILHAAALCAAAGGVEAFCIGSEMRGLTTIRGPGNAFPAVAELRALAAEVRSLLGPGVKISYAADWTEYSGYQPQDESGDRFFHLDPLWADDEIDFIGIDNYMPVSDWRDGHAHLDAAVADSVYEPAYLAANIEGGEYYDWYYASEADRADQIRTPITDGAYGEPWVWRTKDIAGWWQNPHHERIGGVRQATATDWVPQSKQIRFTELGCAAVDKGTNQPNKFLDPKSSESSLPHASSGRRDNVIQQQYLQVVHAYWNDPQHNPVSPVYGGPMLDMSRAYVWAWDARPFPQFPNNGGLWSDGANYRAGHWITGRITGRSLPLVVAEICAAAGLQDYDVSGLYGFVSGYLCDDVSEPRAALQPLMLRHGFDAVERDGKLVFRMRDGRRDAVIDPDAVAVTREIEGRIEFQRGSEAEIAGRMRLRFIEADGDFAMISEEAVLPDEASRGVAGSEMSLAMSRGEGREVVERWLAEARVARDTVRFALPPSRRALGAGDVVGIPSQSGEALYRVDRAEYGDASLFEAVRVEPEIYVPSAMDEQAPAAHSFVAPAPVLPLYLDLPLIRGDEEPHAPHVAVVADPWPGAVAVYSSGSDAGYGLDVTLASRATVGVTRTSLPRGPAGRIDHGPAVEVELTTGSLAATDMAGLLAGQNLLAIGDGSPDGWELLQFRDAELVAPRTYRLGHRLRGQSGTEDCIRDSWPAGSYVVLIDAALRQMSLAPNQRGLERHYRAGPARLGPDDASYRHDVLAFRGNGLRPYAPCHLRVSPSGTGDIGFTWVRRTRLNGDSWDTPEVPLAEESLSFLVRVKAGETTLREDFVSGTSWIYTAADQLSDGGSDAAEFEVAQVSASYGPGAAARISFTM